MNWWIGKIGEYNTEKNESEKLIGVKLDWKLNFDDHILIYM